MCELAVKHHFLIYCYGSLLMWRFMFGSCYPRARCATWWVLLSEHSMFFPPIFPNFFMKFVWVSVDLACGALERILVIITCAQLESNTMEEHTYRVNFLAASKRIRGKIWRTSTHRAQLNISSGMELCIPWM